MSDAPPGDQRGKGGIVLGVLVALGVLVFIGRQRAEQQARTLALGELTKKLPALAQTAFGAGDDLVKKRETVRADVQAIEALADRAGPEGQVMRCSARGIESQILASLDLAEASRVKGAEGLDPASWKDKDALGATRALLERRKAALAKLEKVMTGGSVELAASCMRERKVPAATIVEVETAARGARPPQQEVLFNVQRELLSGSLDLLSLLEKSWGAWRIQPGKSLEFDDRDTGRTYVLATRKLQELELRERELSRGLALHAETLRVKWLPIEEPKPAPSASRAP